MEYWELWSESQLRLGDRREGGCVRDLEELLVDLFEGVDALLEGDVVRGELCLRMVSDDVRVDEGGRRTLSSA